MPLYIVRMYLVVFLKNFFFKHFSRGLQLRDFCLVFQKRHWVSGGNSKDSGTVREGLNAF